MNYIYFVSFTETRKGFLGLFHRTRFFNEEFVLGKKILGDWHIHALERNLERDPHHRGNITIIFYKLVRTEPTNENRRTDIR